MNVCRPALAEGSPKAKLTKLNMGPFFASKAVVNLEKNPVKRQSHLIRGLEMA
jgi:hypothetical protein